MSRPEPGTAGSSPRMRGALSRDGLVREHVGIIPAYAGSTIPRRSGSRACRDHPRVCGEHFFCMYSSGESRGSSPRMRGARTDDSGNASPIGIIPAYAGSTGTVTDSLTTSGDHPRVCGEHHATRPSPPTP